MIGDGKYVNVLNTKDGFELIYDAEQGEVLSYMGLQYSFWQSQESFYNLRTSQFNILEILPRLQGFYEYIRSQLYLSQKLQEPLKNKDQILKIALRDVDVSTNSYKSKYISEQSYTQLDMMFLRQFFTPTEEQLNSEDFKQIDIQKQFLKNFKRIAFFPL